MDFQPPPDPCEVMWRIEREGRSWRGEEARSRHDLSPDKLELINGKIVCSEDARLRLLGLLLENCGADTAVRFGDPEIWRQAVASLDDPEANLRFAVTAVHRMWQTVLWSGEPGDAIRFLERWTTDDYEESIRDNGESHTQSRDAIVKGLTTHQSQKNELFPAYRQSNILIERVRLEDGTATVISTLTALRYRREKGAENQWRSLPPVTEGERWQEDWRETAAGWRIARRTRLETWTVE